MKHKLAILMAAAGLCLAAPAMAQGGYQQEQPLPDISQHNFTLPPEPEARADELRLKGRCDVAVRIYRALVAQGPGYELAQFNLGRCLYEMATAQPATAAALKQEAADWTLKAATAGLPNAQNGLITIYLDGNGVAADPVEAGKWSLIYHGNDARRMFGLPDVSRDLQARLDAVLTEKTWAVAQSRADAWVPATQSFAK